VCFYDCQLVFFSYACSVVYFSLFTVAILTALSNPVACTFVACFSINTHYSVSNHYLFMLGLIVIRLLVYAQWRREGGRGCNVPGTVVGALGQAACFDKK